MDPRREEKPDERTPVLQFSDEDDMSLSSDSFDSENDEFWGNKHSSDDSSLSEGSGDDVDGSGSQSDDGAKPDDWDAVHSAALSKWAAHSSDEEDKDKKQRKAKGARRVRAEGARQSSAQQAAAQFSRVEQSLAQAATMNEKELIGLIEQFKQPRSGRSLNKVEYAQAIEALYKIAKDAGFHVAEIELLYSLTMLQLDYISGDSIAHYAIARCTQYLNDLMHLCIAHNYGRLLFGVGNVCAAVTACVDKLQNAVNRVLIQFDSQTVLYFQYLEHLNALTRLVLLNRVLLQQFECNAASKAQNFDAIVHLLYYMSDAEVEKYLDKCLREDEQHDLRSVLPASSFIKSAADYVLQIRHPTAVTVLCKYAYNLAVNGKLNEVRLVLQHTILHDLCVAGSNEQKLYYNCAMRQAGLLAFQEGNGPLVLHFLSEFICSPRSRELLGQAVAGGRSNRELVRDRADSKTHLPLYLRVNPELIDAAYHIYYILSELQYLHVDLLSDKLSARSHRFGRLIEHYALSNTPSESHRDIIYQVALCINDFELAKVGALLRSLNIWEHFDEKAFGLVYETCKKTALNCFLQQNLNCLKTFDSHDLALMFDLPQTSVVTYINEMIVRSDIRAAWDADFKYLHTNGRQQSLMQTRAFRLMAPLSILIPTYETNLNKLKN